MPLGAPSQLIVVYVQIKGTLTSIEQDLVAVVYETNRAANRGLGGDVKGNSTQLGAAHPAVSDAHHVARSSLAQERSGLMDRDGVGAQRPGRHDAAEIAARQALGDLAPQSPVDQDAVDEQYRRVR
jgi:hypothetical protein